MELMLQNCWFERLSFYLLFLIQLLRVFFLKNGYRDKLSSRSLLYQFKLLYRALADLVFPLLLLLRNFCFISSGPSYNDCRLGNRHVLRYTRGVSFGEKRITAQRDQTWNLVE